MTAAQILEELKPLGRPGYKKILLNHGAKEPVLGVKIEDLKKFHKRIKKDYHLALELYDSGIYDAMYLAGLIADETKMTKKNLRQWLDNATCGMLTEYTIPWLAAESRYGRELAMAWIDSKDENTASAGWATLTSLVSIKDDSELDLPELKRLLDRVTKTIHQQPDRVRYSMNAFVIAAGSFVQPLTDVALKAATAIGPVTVDMGNTACKVPSARDYILKVQKRGAIGKKRETARC